MNATPRIADISLSKIQFQPGDRVVVKVKQPLDKSEWRKLRKTIERWAGDHVEVLMMEAYKYDLEVDQGTKPKIFIG